MKLEVIKKIEENEGVLSSMMMGTFDKDLEKYFKDKKVEIIYSEIINKGGVLKWWEVIYETAQKFYIHISHNKSDVDKWSMNIYYKSEQLNELIIYTNQLLKQFK